MGTKYTREEILTRVEGAARTMPNFYQQPFVNYTGTLLGEKEYDTEVVASYLLQRPHLWDQIPTITRSSYRVAGHDGIAQNPDSNQEEAHLAYALANHHLTGLGTILDYQVPLKRSLHDNTGKIDLIADDGTAIYLLELKQGNSSETLLRCVLEILTYWHTVNHSKLIESFLGKAACRTVVPAVLLPEACRAYQELEEVRHGKRPQLAALMAQHGVQAFWLDSSLHCHHA